MQSRQFFLIYNTGIKKTNEEAVEFINLIRLNKTIPEERKTILWPKITSLTKLYHKACLSCKSIYCTRDDIGSNYAMQNLLKTFGWIFIFLRHYDVQLCSYFSYWIPHGFKEININCLIDQNNEYNEPSIDFRYWTFEVDESFLNSCYFTEVSIEEDDLNLTSDIITKSISSEELDDLTSEDVDISEIQQTFEDAMY